MTSMNRSTALTPSETPHDEDEFHEPGLHCPHPPQRLRTTRRVLIIRSSLVFVCILLLRVR
ncbi:hypothetical protein J6590_049219 [Homalodisca vitripennis]|nr:hypothetical protein J6590_049219 [Homalodisca vitripennis]